MSEILQRIAAEKRLARMRMGQMNQELEIIPSTRSSDNPVQVALVPLTEAELMQSLQYALKIEIGEDSQRVDPVYEQSIRDRAQMQYSLMCAIRVPGTLDRVYESVELMLDEEYGLDADDINFLAEVYDRLMDDSSPQLEGLTEEQLENLKKAFAALDLNALSGKAWWHTKGLFQSLTAQQLTDSWRGLISTYWSMKKNDESESTPAA